MKIQAPRQQLLELLQPIIGVVERRQTMAVLGNVLVDARLDGLTFLATDSEVELSAMASMPIEQPGVSTLPGRKLLDILRALPDDPPVTLTIDEGKGTLRCGRSRFTLATLPVDGLPVVGAFDVAARVILPQASLRRLIEKTHFAMAQQDVRYYLNGLCIEFREDAVRAVATDGHRLAMAEIEAPGNTGEIQQVLVPRKGVQELLRLLTDDEELTAEVLIGENHIRVNLQGYCLTSKLIDGQFPDYNRAIPAVAGSIALSDRTELRNALNRASILANENRGVRVSLSDHLLRIQANNPEQEEAREELEVNYQGEPLEIGFNVSYLLDALGALQGDTVNMAFADAGSSCLLREEQDNGDRYVVSPMRL